MKLYGLEKKHDLQKLSQKIEKTMEKVLNASTALIGLSIYIKTKSTKESLSSKSVSVEKIARYLYDMNLKVNKHLKKN